MRYLSCRPLKCRQSVWRHLIRVTVTAVRYEWLHVVYSCSPIKTEFLSNRIQAVRINNKTSEYIPVKSGVPRSVCLVQFFF